LLLIVNFLEVRRERWAAGACREAHHSRGDSGRACAGARDSSSWRGTVTGAERRSPIRSPYAIGWLSPRFPAAWRSPSRPFSRPGGGRATAARSCFL
jgi:hypothetical protein